LSVCFLVFFEHFKKDLEVKKCKEQRGYTLEFILFPSIRRSCSMDRNSWSRLNVEEAVAPNTWMKKELFLTWEKPPDCSCKG